MYAASFFLVISYCFFLGCFYSFSPKKQSLLINYDCLEIFWYVMDLASQTQITHQGYSSDNWKRFLSAESPWRPSFHSTKSAFSPVLPWNTPVTGNIRQQNPQRPALAIVTCYECVVRGSSFVKGQGPQWRQLDRKSSGQWYVRATSQHF